MAACRQGSYDFSSWFLVLLPQERGGIYPYHVRTPKVKFFLALSA